MTVGTPINLAILVFSFLLAASAAAEQQLDARVVRVSDGDTIVVEIGSGRERQREKVRLIGIDAPELGDDRPLIRCFAAAAKERLKEMVAGKTVRLVIDPAVANRDRFGRLLRYIYLPGGENVNLTLLEEGYAHHYIYRGEFYAQRDVFRAAATRARDESAGISGNALCR